MKKTLAFLAIQAVSFTAVFANDALACETKEDKTAQVVECPSTCECPAQETTNAAG